MSEDGVSRTTPLFHSEIESTEMNRASPAERYDEILYPGFAFPQTHPDRLTTIAKLFGMETAPIQGCRVLELGCGNGGNLIPMAFFLPQSQFLGWDIAERPIAQGRERITGWGLKNISLRRGDILEFPPEAGQFDYIIAHGVYSWVPVGVRDKLLRICRDHLASQGVAYVSYSAYPGGHVDDMIREMLLFHVQNFHAPRQQIDQAKALIKFLLEAQTGTDPFQSLLEQKLKRMQIFDDHGLYHDDLAPMVHRLYFGQFMEHASEHHLQYLAEANYFEMQETLYPPATREMLNQLPPNRVLKEQYLDFLRCRKFRQTLLCREGIALQLTPRPEQMKEYLVSSAARPAPADLARESSQSHRFIAPNGLTLEAQSPLASATLLQLSQAWPDALNFMELSERVRSQIHRFSTPQAESDFEQALCEMILYSYSSGLLELHLFLPPIRRTVSEYPVASPLARLEIEHGDIVTNLQHRNVHVKDKLGKRLLKALDGSKSRAELLKDLDSVQESGHDYEGSSESSAGQVSSVPNDLILELETSLQNLAQLGLLSA